MIPAKQRAEPLYVADSFDSKDSWLFLLNQVRTKFLATLDAALAEHDITSAQWGILRMIGDGRGHTAAELCRHYGYDTGSMTRMLDRLEEKGLVQRERSSQDRRQVHVAITTAGEALALAGLRTMVAVLNDYLRGFDRTELDTFKDYLRRILANSDA